MMGDFPRLHGSGDNKVISMKIYGLLLDPTLFSEAHLRKEAGFEAQNVPAGKPMPLPDCQWQCLRNGILVVLIIHT